MVEIYGFWARSWYSLPSCRLWLISLCLVPVFSFPCWTRAAM